MNPYTYIVDDFLQVIRNRLATSLTPHTSDALKRYYLFTIRSLSKTSML